MQLVLGYPGPVARRVVQLLSVRGGRRAAVIGGSELAGDLPEGVELVAGDPRRIDWGLRGQDYRRLLDSVESITAAIEPETPDGRIETSALVRSAAELAEFVRAGGAPGGVSFLSSLLVFGNATGNIHEDDFEVGQGFGDKYERSAALAEKIVRSVSSSRALAIVRVGPVVGDEEDGSLISSSPLARLIQSLGAPNSEVPQVFSDAPVRFETVGRAARALLSLPMSKPLQVAHLVDREPMTDRQLVHFVAGYLGKTIRESHGGGAAWVKWARPSYGGSRALRGWPLQFGRTVAEREFPELLDRDDASSLEKILRTSGATEE